MTAAAARQPAVSGVPGSSVGFMSISLVERLTSSNGVAFMLRAKMRGAEFRPAALIHRRGGRLVAEIFYQDPIGPERESSLIVQLWLALPGDAQ